MDIVKELSLYENYKVQLDTDRGIYQGILIFVDPDTTKIGLGYAEKLPEHEREIGLQCFFAEDISSYTIIGEREEELKHQSTNQPKKTVTDKEILNLLLNDSDSEPEEENKPVKKVEDDKGEYVLTLPSTFEDALPEAQLYIDCLNEQFDKAVRHIKGESIIGVGVEGRNIGRFGKVCLVLIATEQGTILFDICTLKEKAFEHGLKDIFENPNIEKVIHDCRQVSDALYHLYGTKLVNVFDTVVSHLFISKLYSRSERDILPPLDLLSCLEKYLNMNCEDFCILRNGPVGSNQTIVDWACRPLPFVLRDLAIQNVIYLRLLKEVCTKKMLGEFYKAVSFFNKVIRDRASSQLKQDKMSPDPMLSSLAYAGLFVKTVQMGECLDNKNSSNATNTGTKYLNLVKTVFRPEETNGWHAEEEKKQLSANKKVLKDPPVKSRNAKVLELASIASMDAATRKLSTTKHSNTKFVRDENKKNVINEVIWPTVDASCSSRKLNLIPAGMPLE